MGILFIGIPKLFYVIGDSHAFAYRELLFERQYVGKRQLVLMKSHFIPDLQTSTFTHKDGTLRTRVNDVLLVEGLIDFDREAARKALPGTPPPAAHVTTRGTESTILFHAGDIDVRTEFLQKLPEDMDFELANVPAGIERLRGDFKFRSVLAPNVPIEQAQRLIRPLFVGLATLKALGIGRLVVHNLPPPTTSESDFVSANGFFRQPYIRYKAYLLFNRIFESYCREAGIMFLNMWPYTTVNDILDQKYYLDGAHLNRDGVFLSARALLEAP